MDLQEKIDRISSLGDNWNGHGATRVPEEVLVRAKELATPLKGCGFEVFPTGRDSVQFEKTAGGVYLEIEVFADRVETYCETERPTAPLDPTDHLQRRPL